MPYVTVYFDTAKVPQHAVNKLKLLLQPLVAEALSDVDTRADPTSVEDIETDPNWVIVLQHAYYPTDVNAPPLEIYIVCGQPKGRSGDKVVELIITGIKESGIIDTKILGENESGVFLIFNEHNGFRFIN
jgi:hypothetical protein